MTINPDKIWARGIGALAIAAATVALAGCSLLGQATGGGTGTDDGGDGEGTDTSAFAIKVGDCLNDADVSGEVETVPVIACTEPHDSEAYASIIMDDGDFPGADEVDTQAQDGCLGAFEGYVGAELRRLEVRDLVLLPHRGHLGQRGPRDPLRALRPGRPDDRFGEGHRPVNLVRGSGARLGGHPLIPGERRGAHP